MSNGINKVILVGRLGNDPEVRYTQSGSAIASISVATYEAWKDKQTGDQQERTEWHRVSLFNRLGEIAGEYLRKGSQVYIEGKLQTRKWQDKEGNDRYTTEIVANVMQMLGGKAEGSGQSQQDHRGHPGSNQPNPAPQSNESAGPAPSPAEDFDDSDIPF